MSDHAEGPSRKQFDAIMGDKPRPMGFCCGDAALLSALAIACRGNPKLPCFCGCHRTRIDDHDNTVIETDLDRAILVRKAIESLAEKVAAWRPVVEAACAQLAACESVAREYRNERHAETWREATVATENAVRALAPEHRPAAGGGA